MDLSEIQKAIAELQGSVTNHLNEMGEFKSEVERALLTAYLPRGLWGASSEQVDRKAIGDYLRSWARGDEKKARELMLEHKAMSEGSDPDGGFFLPDATGRTITKVLAEISPIGRMARNITVRGPAYEEPIDKDNTTGATWVGESTARPETTTPQVGKLRIEMFELYALPKLTQQLIEDAYIDIEAWLTEKVADAFGIAESAAFHTGDGISKPRGILTYTTTATADATRTWGQLEHIATGASGAFPTASTSVNSADVLVDVVAALKAQYRSGAAWLMNKKTAGAVRKLKDADGRHIWTDSLVLGQPSTLLGYAVEIDENMPDIAAGTLSIAFGNFLKGYTVIRHPARTLLRDPYSSKPNVLYYVRERVGGMVNNFEAIKFLKFS